MEKEINNKLLGPVKAAPFPLAMLDLWVAVPLNNGALEAALSQELATGRLYRTFSGKIGSPETHPLRVGKVSANSKGFGFLTTEAEEEFFVAPQLMRQVLPGDWVEFCLVPSQKDKTQTQAEFVRILPRTDSFWLGQLTERNGRWVLTPDDPVFVELWVKAAPGVSPEDVVQVRVPADTALGTSAEALLTQNLGPRTRPGFDTDYACAKWLIPAAADAAEQASAQDALATADDLVALRRDIRHLRFVTIDGESTRDFDDAVYAEATEYGFHLWVAVADVAHFVRPGTLLDTRAQNRGNSVYFPDKVIPMLPEALSNGVCSLNPGEDRFALVCEMYVSADGKITSSDFYPAHMRSHARLTYRQVSDHLAGNPAAATRGLDTELRTLDALQGAFQVDRDTRGTLEVRSREPKAVFENGRVTDIQWFEATRAHKLVEDCMLAANRSAAHWLQLHGVPGLFRHHAAPQGEAWDESRAWFSDRGIHLPPELTLKDLQSLLSSSRERADFSLIEENLRRAMQPAVYDPSLSSHFSLGLEAYAHFTSPIRRYPDLVVHRALRALVAQQPHPPALPDTLAAHCGICNRRAVQATRHVWGLIKRRHLAKHLGETFQGKVVLANRRGARVVLTDWEIAGWLPSSQVEKLGLMWDVERERWVGAQPWEPGVLVTVVLDSASPQDLGLMLPRA